MDTRWSRLAGRLRRALRQPVRDYPAYRALLAGQAGLEIGGPSKLFRRELPLYRDIAALDGVNFSHSTVWEGELVAGQTFEFAPGRTGRQYIGEGADLGEVADGQYDFLISCNNLEHMANPLAALLAWRRVVRPGGHILLVLPRKESNFDHRRSITPFEHLLDDLQRGTDEHDLTHLDEILALHDRSMDPASGDLAAFKARSLRNFENRCLHHHVFDQALMDRMFQHIGMPVVLRTTLAKDHVALARRPMAAPASAPGPGHA